MSSKTDYRHIAKCDKCGHREIWYSDEGEDEGVLPNGWAQLTMRIWDDQKPDSTSGNDRLFADLCHACIPRLGFGFHDSSEDDLIS